jgi:hypothetical protein
MVRLGVVVMFLFTRAFAGLHLDRLSEGEEYCAALEDRGRRQAVILIIA